MVNFTVESNADNAVARLGEITPRVAAELRTVVEALQDELLGKVRAATPVRTGALRDHIEGRVSSTSTGSIATIGANPTGEESQGSRRDFYALFVEYGANLPVHEILPDTKQALHFALGGDVFAKRVRFPGGAIEAEEFIHGPFKEMRPEIKRRIKAAVEGKL